MNSSDYVGQSNVMLTFNATTRSVQVEVDLIDDMVFETDEHFNGILTLVSDSPRVTIDRGSTVATIVEDEGEQNLLTIQIFMIAITFIDTTCIILYALQT